MSVNALRLRPGSDSLEAVTLTREAGGTHLAHDDDVRGAVLFAAHDGTGGMASLSDRQRDIIMDAFVQAQRM